ncbi:MAG: disulfide bond formation protein B [Simkaniaceae bacterium]|nr:disulfide bond formation protein B [Simkaniaceae bacterium]
MPDTTQDKDNSVYLLYFSWLISALAMLGSLYFSEVRHIDPCHLCWIQRICLYPLAIILAIATHQGFFGIAPYAFPLALGGLITSAYQVAIQEIPGWEPINVCGAGPSCGERISIGLGPITIPILSLIACAILLTLICLIWCYSRKRRE